MEHWVMCSERVGLGCGGEGCRVRLFSGGPEGFGHCQSRSLSEGKLPKPAGDAPEADNLELQFLDVSQSLQTGSGT